MADDGGNWLFTTSAARDKEVFVYGAARDKGLASHADGDDGVKGLFGLTGLSPSYAAVLVALTVGDACATGAGSIDLNGVVHPFSHCRILLTRT